LQNQHQTQNDEQLKAIQQQFAQEQNQALAQLESLQTQVDELQPFPAQVETLQQLLAAARTEGQQLKDQIGVLTAAQDQLRPIAELEALQTQLETATAQLVSVTAELEQTRQSSISDAALETELQAVIKERDRIRQELTHTIAELQTQIADRETNHPDTEQIATLEAQLNTLHRERAQQASVVTATAAEVEQLQAQLQTITQAHQDLEQRFKQAKQQPADFEEQLAVKQRECDRVGTELQRAKAEILKLQDQVRDSGSQQQLQSLELENLEHQKAGIEEALEQAIASAAPLAEQVITLTNHRDLLMSEVGDAEAEIAALQENIQTLETNLTHVTQALQTAEAQPIAAQQALQQEYNQLQKDFTQAQSAQQDALQQVADLEAQKREVAQERDRLAVELQQAQSAQRDAVQQVDKLQAQKEQLMQERDRLAAERQATTSPPPQSQEQSGSDREIELQQTIQALTQEQEQLTQQFEMACQAGAELEEQVERLQKEKTDLEEAMQLAQTVVASLQQQVTQLTPASSAAAGTGDQPQSIPESTPNPQPEPAPDQATGASIAGQSFVITGKLTSLSSDRVKTLIEAAGGRINTHPSAKTNYIVVGHNPGSKLQKAEQYGIPQLTEAQLLELLNLNPRRPSSLN
jgi:chromosome segregation ATPase